MKKYFLTLFLILFFAEYSYAFPPSPISSIDSSDYDSGGDGTIDSDSGGTGADLSGMTGVLCFNSGTAVDGDTAAELVTYFNVGSFFSTAFASGITSEALWKAAVNLEAGTDFYSTGAVDALVGAKQDTLTDGSIPDGYVNDADLDQTIQWESTNVTASTDPYEITISSGQFVRYDITGNADNTTLTMSETGAVDKAFALLVNVATNTLDIADSDAVCELIPSGVTIYLEQNESLLLQYQDDRWRQVAVSSSVISFASINMGGGTLEIPNQAASDLTLSNLGEIGIDDTDDAFGWNDGANGEIAGEVQLSGVQHKSWSFDPVTVYNTTLHRMKLMDIGDDAPNGIIIDEWHLEFDADPTAEIDCDLKRADAFIGVANAAVVDVLDTTNGDSTEDTDANINSGAAISNGQILYIQIDTAYAEVGHSCTLDIWYHAEED